VGETAKANPDSAWQGRLELPTVVIPSVTTILTAWSAIPSSKWAGAMSIAFSLGSTARIEKALLGLAVGLAVIGVALLVTSPKRI
jgi:hypothetical protein